MILALRVSKVAANIHWQNKTAVARSWSERRHLRSRYPHVISRQEENQVDVLSFVNATQDRPSSRVFHRPEKGKARDQSYLSLPLGRVRQNGQRSPPVRGHPPSHWKILSCPEKNALWYALNEEGRALIHFINEQRVVGMSFWIVFHL